MKLILTALIALIPTFALATGGTKPPPAPTPPPVQKTKNVTVNNKPTATAGAAAMAATGAINNTNTAKGGNADVDVQVNVASSPASLTAAGTSVSVPETRIATAPDVIGYPTAPCRVAIGGSVGVVGFSGGVVGSELDEGCSLAVKSTHLNNLGHKGAATQILCLDEQFKQALEVDGVKCLLQPKAAPQPTERVAP